LLAKTLYNITLSLYTGGVFSMARVSIIIIDISEYNTTVQYAATFVST